MMRKFQNNLLICFWNGKACFWQSTQCLFIHLFRAMQNLQKDLNTYICMYPLDYPICLLHSVIRKTFFPLSQWSEYSAKMFQCVMEYYILSLMIPMCKMCSLNHVSACLSPHKCLALSQVPLEGPHVENSRRFN